MVPWFERPVIYDVRARPHLVESTSGSRDLQMVILFLGLVKNAVIIFPSMCWGDELKQMQISDYFLPLSECFVSCSTRMSLAKILENYLMLVRFCRCN